MANELNITQEFRTMTLNLPADTVTVQIVVKTLKGQYGVCQNNNHREMTFNPWSEDLQPMESFMRVVREMQIRPDRYYLETCMHQTLGKNYGYGDHMPNVCIYGQLPPRDNNDEDLQIQSPCPSNWSDDLLEIDNNKAKSKEQTEQPANHIMTLAGTRVPQDVLAHASTTLRLPQTVPQALKIQEQNNKTKQNGKPKQKTRPPYKTWTWKRPQKQDEQEQK